MPTLRIVDDVWYDHNADQVLVCLLAWVPHGGMEFDAVRAKLNSCGFSFTLPELVEIRDRLIADGKIEIDL